MKRFSHYLVLTTILGIGGGLVASQSAALADPQETVIETAMVATPTAPPKVVHVPTPAALADVRNSDIVPPLDVSATEARQWVADAGYTAVSPLTLAMTSDGLPVYRGTAKADGKTYAVIVDSWGNIAGWQ